MHELFFTADEEAAAAAIEAASPAFTEDFVCVLHGLSTEERPGVSGLRQAWIDWLEPWVTYRAEIEEARDLGDRVLVFSSDVGERPELDGEIEMKAGSIWTVRDGRIARAEFFPIRADAVKAAGL